MAVGTSCSGGQCTGSTKYSYTIGYTPNSNILSATDSVNGQWTYTYDDFNRVVTSNCSSHCPDGASTQGFSYDYDRYGNRWPQTVTAGSGPQPMYSFGGLNNRLDGYSYDAAGNLLNDLTHRYTYDPENRIISEDNGATTYAYDAAGERVAKTNGGTVTDIIYDREGHVILYNSTVPAGTPFVELYVVGMHLGTYDMNSTVTATIFYYDHSDWLGTERARTSLAGVACETMVSLPFGDGQAISGNCADVSYMHFTGKERDSESCLDNFGKRYHASSLGRFMTPDPIMIMKQKLRDPQQWNMYSYTRNNPVTFTDPTGAYTCQGNKDQCAQIRAGYDAAQKALAAAKPKSDQAKQLKSVLDFLGAPGKANGVAVTFGKLDTGTPAQTSTETTRDLLGTSHTTTTITFDLQQLNPACQTDFWASLGALGERHRRRSDA